MGILTSYTQWKCGQWWRNIYNNIQ